METLTTELNKTLMLGTQRHTVGVEAIPPSLAPFVGQIQQLPEVERHQKLLALSGSLERATPTIQPTTYDYEINDRLNEKQHKQISIKAVRSFVAIPYEPFDLSSGLYHRHYHWLGVATSMELKLPEEALPAMLDAGMTIPAFSTLIERLLPANARCLAGDLSDNRWAWASYLSPLAGNPAYPITPHHLTAVRRQRFLNWADLWILIREWITTGQMSSFLHFLPHIQTSYAFPEDVYEIKKLRHDHPDLPPAVQHRLRQWQTWLESEAYHDDGNVEDNLEELLKLIQFTRAQDGSLAIKTRHSTPNDDDIRLWLSCTHPQQLCEAAQANSSQIIKAVMNHPHGHLWLPALMESAILFEADQMNVSLILNFLPHAKYHQHLNWMGAAMAIVYVIQDAFNNIIKAVMEKCMDKEGGLDILIPALQSFGAWNDRFTNYFFDVLERPVIYNSREDSHTAKRRFFEQLLSSVRCVPLDLSDDYFTLLHLHADVDWYREYRQRLRFMEKEHEKFVGYMIDR